MKSLVIYDSQFGNTAILAKSIAKSINCEAISIKDFKNELLDNVDLLIIGSPTQGGLATKPIQEFINSLKIDKSTKIAVFDTRFSTKDHNMALKLIIKTFGFASIKMAKQLESIGFQMINKPKGFIVSGKKGPLKKDEIERASEWAKNILIAI